MAYSDTLTKIQEMRRALREAERQAENEAVRMQPLTETDERRMYADQAEFDPAYAAAYRKAPPPLAHERPGEYRRRLVAGLSGYSDRWRKADFDAMSDDVLAIAGPQVRADAIANGKTAGLRPGELREITKNNGGAVISEFIGDPDTTWFGQTFTRRPAIARLKSHAEYADMARTDAMRQVSEVIRHRPLPQPVRGAHAGF